MTPRARPDDPAFTTTEKLMQTFRMPRELVTFLKQEATRGGRDLRSARWVSGPPLAPSTS